MVASTVHTIGHIHYSLLTEERYWDIRNAVTWRISQDIPTIKHQQLRRRIGLPVTRGRVVYRDERQDKTWRGRERERRKQSEWEWWWYGNLTDLATMSILMSWRKGETIHIHIIERGGAYVSTEWISNRNPSSPFPSLLTLTFSSFVDFRLPYFEVLRVQYSIIVILCSSLFLLLLLIQRVTSLRQDLDLSLYTFSFSLFLRFVIYSSVFGPLLYQYSTGGRWEEALGAPGQRCSSRYDSFFF